MTAKFVSAPSSNRALTASIGKNTLFGVGGNLVHVLARVIVVPVMIRHLGLDGYGIWAVLMSIAAYITLGGAGVKSAFQKYVAEATGTGDFDRASRLLSTGTAAVLLLSLLVLVPLAIFSHWLAIAVGVPNAFLNPASRSIQWLALTAIVVNVSQTYQSILMGAHRIDLREKLNVVLDLLNTVAVVVLLYRGFGLLSMAVVFCLYELASGVLWYIFARRVLPDVRVAPAFVSRSVVKELIRFGGSYQLVSMLELLYAAILPVAILKFFGANDAGVFALAARLVGFATLVQGPYLQAILSGGSLVYASGSGDQINAFIVKSFKAMAVLSILPLAFIAFYGTRIAFVWTGKTDPFLEGAVCLLCAAGVCRSLSSLCRVLYRVSGGAVMDNAQLLLGLGVALLLWPFGHRIGFYGMVGGVQFVGQFLGLILMSLSLTSRFKGFHPRILAPNLLRFCVAAAVILSASVIALYLGVHWGINHRVLETIRLATAALISLLVAVPALLVTGSISRSEARTMLNTVSRKFAATA
ncbi:MAG TPA: oligosaccharide flippase family protein [Acidobacteriaceae bacterium]|jgi:O-antigen/teichoic acid export membrane protein|nr:oligosaccharide flippase family protein [Acidobacteriaceae bacterium]